MVVKNYSKLAFGFTIVEILIVISIIGILASISVFGFSSWRKSTADNTVKNDLLHAKSGMQSYKNFKNDYPPNLAGVGFAASNTVALALYTNAPQTRTYSGLTSDQNAQLFLNSCNAAMPIVSGGTMYNTSCSFVGNNLHVAGTVSANVVFQGPTILSSDIVLTCGAACTAAATQIINEFLSQNGTFPLSVPKQQVALPEPTFSTYGSATKYCLEGRSSSFSDIIYSTTSTSTGVQAGSCPADPDLHYP